MSETSPDNSSTPSPIGFENGPLTDLVGTGLVEPTGVRIWFRSEHPGKHRVSWWPADEPSRRCTGDVVIEEDNRGDNTATLLIPGDLADCVPLEPLTRYEYEVTRLDDGFRLGSGRFRTAPVGPALLNSASRRP